MKRLRIAAFGCGLVLPLFACGKHEEPSATVTQEVKLSQSSVAPGDHVRIVSVVRNISDATVNLVIGRCDEVARIDGVLEQMFTREPCLGLRRRVALAPGTQHEEDGLAVVRSVDPGDYVVRVWHAFDPDSPYLDELAMVGEDVNITVTTPH